MTRIDGLGTLGTSRTTGGRGAAPVESSAENDPAEPSRPAGRQDLLAVSSRGRVVAAAAAAVHAAPDVRSDEVHERKTAIANGSYTSNAGEIAQRLIANPGFTAD